MSALVETLIRSLDEHPEDWRSTGFEMIHPKAVIWIANGSWGLSAKSQFGHWGGTVMFALPGSSRWRLWKAFKRWQAAELATEFAA